VQFVQYSVFVEATFAETAEFNVTKFRREYRV
jgi:hypothetical protein